LQAQLRLFSINEKDKTRFKMLSRVIKSARYAVKLSQVMGIAYSSVDIYEGNISSLALLIASLYMEKCTVGTMEQIAHFISPPYSSKDWRSLNTYDRIRDIIGSCLELNGVNYEKRVYAAAVPAHIALDIEIHYSRYSKLLPKKFVADSINAIWEKVEHVINKFYTDNILNALENGKCTDNTSVYLKLTTSAQLNRLASVLASDNLSYHLKLYYKVSAFIDSESARQKIENGLREIKKRDEVITDTIACAALQECHSDETSFVSEQPQEILNAIYNYAAPKNIVNGKDFASIVSTVKNVSLFKPKVERLSTDPDEFILTADNRP